MDIFALEKFIKRWRDRPISTTAYAILAIALALGAAWVFSYVGSIAQQAADDSTEPTPATSELDEGHVIVFDGFTKYNRSGFSFSLGRLVSWNSGDADILVENHDQSGPAHFFMQYEAAPFDGSKQDENAKSGILQMKAASLGEVKECPLGGYEYPRVEVTQGGIYCVRTRDGVHFSKIAITDVFPDRIAFDWVYQPDEKRTFD